MAPPLRPAPTWQVATPILLWHGCVGTDAAAIIKYGVDPTKGRPDADFGRGFYLTSIPRQAKHWAWLKYYSLTPAQQTLSGGPVVLKFAPRPGNLAPLQSLAFVRGHYDYDDYWSLVQHCRQSTTGAIRNHKNTPDDAPQSCNWFDVVYGPVSAFWLQRAAMADSDQISFHTQDAALILNQLIATGQPLDFEVNQVV